MIYGNVKNKKVKKFVRGILTPEKEWLNIGFNDKKVRETGYAMLKYYISNGFYKRRWIYS